MNKHLRSEHGQALVLLVFGVVVLIGFTALAIDGGMVYSDRRHAQSASDAASLAAGGFAALALENYGIERANFNCSNSDLNPGNTDLNSLVNKAITTGMSRANSNDYTNAQVRITAVCEDHGPVFDEKYLEFTTEIVRVTNTSFIHFVYDGPAINQVESTVRVRPRTPGALGNAIVALNTGPCSGNQNGVILGGSSGTFVHGGGIFSNGCLRCNGTGTSHEVIVDPPGGINYVGTSENCGEGELNPAAQPFGEIIPEESYGIPDRNCADYTNRTVPGGKDVVLQPGKYNKIDDGGKDSITFSPGLYCITGSPKAINITTAYYTGTGVTFYATSGRIQITGGGDEDTPSILRAPPQDSGSNPAIDGVLIRMADGNTSPVQLTGNAYTEFSGTVYAPDADITAEGTGEFSSPFGTQLIGLNVEILGNATIDVNFLDDDVYEEPAWIDLSR